MAVKIDFLGVTEVSFQRQKDLKELPVKLYFELVLAVSFVSLIGCGLMKTSTPSEKAEPAASATRAFPTSLEEALSSPFRTVANKERDSYRHPLETLNFLGLQPRMTVIEVSPGAGWYSEILIPYLAPQGKYIAAAVPVTVYAGGQKFVDYVNHTPEFQGKTTVADFAPPKFVNIAEANSVDLVLTFRNVHNWMPSGSEAAAFKAFYSALKPGGILGLVEHRADPKMKEDPKAKSGYVSEKQVIRFAQAAGFRLVKKSEINANPKDTKDYQKGVWTLPPTYTEGDKDRAKYAAIGESDRMTMKFQKPATAKSSK